MTTGHVVHADAEAVERLLHVRVAIDVEVRVRMAVARQELLQRQRARGVARADEDDVARVRGVRSACAAG